LGEYDDLLGNYTNDEVLGAAFLVALIPAAIPIANALLNLKKSGDPGTKAEAEALQGFELGADEEVKQDIINKVVKMITGIFKKNEKAITSDEDAAATFTNDEGEGEAEGKSKGTDKEDAGGSKITKVPKWVLPVGLAAGSLTIAAIVLSSGKKKKS